MQPSSNSAFTLIEISIVLVVIGLLVGGILVGRDMINAAEIRSQISQIQKYNSAVNTFRIKYGGLPGDLRTDLAAAYGFTPRAGTMGRGDGNGLIEDLLAAETFGPEEAMFWNDMSVAGLIDGSLQGTLNQDTGGLITVSPIQISTTFPAAAIGRSNYVTVSAIPSPRNGSGFNYWMVAQIYEIGSGSYLNGSIMTPMEAYNIDIKMDDGMPNTGLVHSCSGSPAQGFSESGAWAVGGGNFYCTMGGTSATDPADTYIRSPANGGNIQNCNLRFRFN